MYTNCTRDATRVLAHDDFIKFYGVSRTQYLAYAKNIFLENLSLETILATAYDDEIGYIIGICLKNSVEKKTKIKVITILSGIETTRFFMIHRLHRKNYTA